MRSITIAALLTASTVCLADSADHPHTHDSLGAHVHGTAQLDIAIEGEQLYVAVQSPAGDLLGFEHSPTTDPQKRKLAETVKLLENPEPLFALDCAIDEAKVESPLLDHASEEHAGHADINVRYQLYCENIELLTELDASGWFKHFPGTERIQVQLISDISQQQSAAQLTPANSKLPLN